MCSPPLKYESPGCIKPCPPGHHLMGGNCVKDVPRCMDTKTDCATYWNPIIYTLANNYNSLSAELRKAGGRRLQALVVDKQALRNKVANAKKEWEWATAQGKNCDVKKCLDSQKCNTKHRICEDRCKKPLKWKAPNCVGDCNPGYRWSLKQQKCVLNCKISQKLVNDECEDLCTFDKNFVAPGCVTSCHKMQGRRAHRKRKVRQRSRPLYPSRL